MTWDWIGLDGIEQQLAHWLVWNKQRQDKSMEIEPNFDGAMRQLRNSGTEATWNPHGNSANETNETRLTKIHMTSIIQPTRQTRQEKCYRIVSCAEGAEEFRPEVAAKKQSNDGRTERFDERFTTDDVDDEPIVHFLFLSR